MTAAPRTTPYEAGSAFAIHWANCPEQMAGLDCATCDELGADLIAAVDAELDAEQAAAGGQSHLNTATQPVLLRSQPNTAGDITGAGGLSCDRAGESPANHSRESGSRSERWFVRGSVSAAVSPTP